MSLTLHDKHFVPFISEKEVEKAIAAIAVRLNKDLKDKKPLFLGIMNGAFIFAADLIRRFEGNCEVSFLKVSSYKGDQSTGQVLKLAGLQENLENRTVVIIEDIVDTGNTLEYLLEELQKHSPKEIKIATLLLKPGTYKKKMPIHYVGIEIPDKFIVGYGLDYDGLGRNLRDIYVVV
jgi:hypoxanthine phosphoribosyltransferase